MRFFSLLAIASGALAGVIPKDTTSDTSPNPAVFLGNVTGQTGEFNEERGGHGTEEIAQIFSEPNYQGDSWAYYPTRRTSYNPDRADCQFFPANVVSSVKFMKNLNAGTPTACYFYQECNCPRGSTALLWLGDSVSDLKTRGWDNHACSMKCYWAHVKREETTAVAVRQEDHDPNDTDTNYDDKPGCSSLCIKYSCCQSEHTCTCGDGQLEAIAAGLLDVETAMLRNRGELPTSAADEPVQEDDPSQDDDPSQEMPQAPPGIFVPRGIISLFTDPNYKGAEFYYPREYTKTAVCAYIPADQKISSIKFLDDRTRIMCTGYTNTVCQGANKPNTELGIVSDMPDLRPLGFDDVLRAVKCFYWNKNGNATNSDSE